MQEQDIALVNTLCGRGVETDHVEFKHGNWHPKTIGKLVSALSNSARIGDHDFAYIIWGVDDKTHGVIGTDFDFQTAKVGNHDFQLWLSQMIQPSLALSFRFVDHPAGRVVLCEIPPATDVPVESEGTAYVRVGGTTPKLSDHLGLHRELIRKLHSFVWEKGIAKSHIDADRVLELLDYPKYFSLTRQPLPDGRGAVLGRLQDDHLIAEDGGGTWNVTNLGAMLFANDVSAFDASLARKAVRFAAYDGTNRTSTVIHSQDGQKGYASGFVGLVDYITGLIPAPEHIGAALRERRPLFPKFAIRELIANALIHQDMTISGAGPQIELFENRIEITNPGRSLIPPYRMIDHPPRSRNEMLGSLMRRMGFCEERGSGLDKVIDHIESSRLPPLKLEFKGESTRAILHGPRTFAEMSSAERVQACYQHAVLKYLDDKVMKNSSLRERLGIDKHNASQVSAVIREARKKELIRIADPERPRAGYYPWWA